MRQGFLFLFIAIAAPIFLPQPGFSEECQIKLAHIPANDGYIYPGHYGIASIKNGVCDLKALNTGPKSGIFMDEHGRRTFQGPDIQGYWNVRDWTLLFGPVSFSTMGSTKRYELPKYEEERKTWLAEIDKEGWVTTYPYSGDVYQRLYPARFTSIGEKVQVQNSQFEIRLQTYQYITMESEARTAVAAQLQLECMTMELVSRSEPEKLTKRQAAMHAFLEAFTLENVSRSPELISKACRPHR